MVKLRNRAAPPPTRGEEGVEWEGGQVNSHIAWQEEITRLAELKQRQDLPPGGGFPLTIGWTHSTLLRSLATLLSNYTTTKNRCDDELHVSSKLQTPFLGTVIVFLMVRENSSHQMEIYSHFSRFCTKWPHECIKFKLLGTVKMQIFCRNVLPPWSVLNFLKMKAAESSEIFATIPQTAVSWSVKRVPNLKVWLLSSPSATNVTEI